MDINNADFWIKIIVSLLCGGIIGFERQLRGKPAGIRTSILICLGTQVFVSHGTALAQGDQYRVLAQVVTGVGFLGAGAILHREGGIVAGLTTAASIWAVAAIGLTAASGLYWLAVLATALVLLLLRFPERRLKR